MDRGEEERAGEQTLAEKLTKARSALSKAPTPGFCQPETVPVGAVRVLTPLVGSALPHQGGVPDRTGLRARLSARGTCEDGMFRV